jgi:hypothetical protein
MMQQSLQCYKLSVAITINCTMDFSFGHPTNESVRESDRENVKARKLTSTPNPSPRKLVIKTSYAADVQNREGHCHIEMSSSRTHVGAHSLIKVGKFLRENRRAAPPTVMTLYYIRCDCVAIYTCGLNVDTKSVPR